MYNESVHTQENGLLKLSRPFYFSANYYVLINYCLIDIIKAGIFLKNE